MRPPRIAVSGAHGAGKTTLVRVLSHALGLPRIEESSRAIARQDDLPDLVGSLGTPARTMRFQWRCVERQRAEERRLADTGFVTDRGWADYLAYPIALGALARAEEDGTYIQVVTELARDAYDLVVLVRPESAPARDGFRSTGRDYQWVIDHLVRGLTAELHPHTQVISASGPLRERLRKVLREARSDDQ